MSKRPRRSSDRKAEPQSAPSTSTGACVDGDDAPEAIPDKYNRIITRPVSGIPEECLERVRKAWNRITTGHLEQQKRHGKNSLGYALDWHMYDLPDFVLPKQEEIDEVKELNVEYADYEQDVYDVYLNPGYIRMLKLMQKTQVPILLPDPIKPADPKPRNSRIGKILDLLENTTYHIVDSQIPEQPEYPVTAEWCPVQTNVLVPDELTLRFLPSIEGDQNPDDFLEELMEAFNKQEWKRKFRYCGYAMHDLINELLCVDNPDKNGLQMLMTQYKDVVKDIDPEMVVFHLITAALPQFHHPQRLKDKHDNFLEDYYGIPRYTETMPNIDRADLFHRVYTADEALHSHFSLFCRRCFKYDCNAHAYYSSVYRPVIEDLIIRKRCGPQCYLNLERVDIDEKRVCLVKQENEGEYPIIPLDQVRNNHWLNNELTVLNLLRQTFDENYCSIAKTFGDKTCVEVYVMAKVLIEDGFEVKGRPDRGIPNARTGNTKMPKKKKSGKSWAAHYNKLKTNESDRKDNDDCAKIFIPCDHPDRPCDKECPCVKGNSFCEKYCNCPADCPERFPGCKCKAQCTTRACPCFSAVRECDPDLCQSCNAGAFNVADIKCRNVNIQRGLKKHLLVSHSQVAGWGCFLNGTAEKNEFISEYCGEIISHDEADRRGKIYDKQKCSFLFNLNTEQVIDAKKKGNKIRFANHSETPNCYARVMMVNGDHRIGIYAMQHIKRNEELFFDYRYGKNDKLKFVNAEKPIVIPGITMKTEK